MIYGYARVSTDGQSVAAQVAALRKHGAGKVFREDPLPKPAARRHTDCRNQPTTARRMPGSFRQDGAVIGFREALTRAKIAGKPAIEVLFERFAMPM